jgi:hypothetical protein
MNNKNNNNNNNINNNNNLYNNRKEKEKEKDKEDEKEKGKRKENNKIGFIPPELDNDYSQITMESKNLEKEKEKKTENEKQTEKHSEIESNKLPLEQKNLLDTVFMKRPSQQWANINNIDSNKLREIENDIIMKSLNINNAIDNVNLFIIQIR